MTTKAHKLLTGTDLHEPKGVETALTGQVYVADGVGSGSWVTINTSITASTGDIKPTLKIVADSGWIFMSDNTIGDASSGATNRANADTQALFVLLWTGVPDAWAPVSTGRGVSAASDFAAHKTITLPRVLGRALAGAGTGSGLTGRVFGSWTGTESNTLVAGNIPSLTSINAAQPISVNPASGFLPVTGGSIVDGTFVTGAGHIPTSTAGWASTGSLSANNSISVTYTNASPTSITTQQPSFFVNFMIKL